jgi:hypothetical protein
MARQFMLPTAAIMSLVGAAMGVYLGNGAIGEINPAHFKKEAFASKFYADMVPNRSRDWASVQLAELSAAEMGQALGKGCVGCRTYPEEYYPVHEASLGKPQVVLAQVAEAAPAVAETENGVTVHRGSSEPPPPPNVVERYAHFQVSAEEGQQELAMADAGGQAYEEPSAE